MKILTESERAKWETLLAEAKGDLAYWENELAHSKPESHKQTLAAHKVIGCHKLIASIQEELT